MVDMVRRKGHHLLSKVGRVAIILPDLPPSSNAMDLRSRELIIRRSSLSSSIRSVMERRRRFVLVSTMLVNRVN